MCIYVYIYIYIIERERGRERERERYRALFAVFSRYAYVNTYLPPPDAALEAEAQGKRLHTRNHTSEIPLENATENPLDISSGNPLEK